MELISAQPPNSLDRESMKEHVGGWLDLSLLSSDKTLSQCNSLNLLICSQHICSVFFQGPFSIALLLGLDTCFFPKKYLAMEQGTERFGMAHLSIATLPVSALL